MNEEENEWYIKHKKQMLSEGKYHDPCKDCGGEDCACCEYGRGY